MIIGDYNHLFDPVAKLQRFFGGEQKSNHVVLCDEAHNLWIGHERCTPPDCVRRNCRNGQTFKKGISEAVPSNTKNGNLVSSEEKRLLEQCGFTPSSTKPLEVQEAFPEQLVTLASNFIESYEAALAERRFCPFGKNLSPILSVNNFCIAAQQYDERYTTYW